MKYIIITLLTAATFCFNLFKQDVELKGIVTDANSGNPVASAVITVKGSSHSTTSGTDGTFTLMIPSYSSTITITAVGYGSKEIKLNGKKYLNIQLTTISQQLEEVVVSGYSRDEESAIAGRVAGIMLGRQQKVGATSQYMERQFNTEDYDAITENRFLEATSNPLSTFSIDVDGASYSNVRRFLQNRQLPPPGSVRVEEMINYFRYDYPQPVDDLPFSINTEAAACPWNEKHQLVMIGLQAKKINAENLPAANLVFLLDVSGSMMDENKLPLVKSSIKLLVDQLRENDRVSIVVYAGSAGLVLPSTSGANKQKILDALNSLEAGGSTAGGEGIRLAYDVARTNFIPSGNNRVILCTDGDFNVGVSSDAALEKIIEEERKSNVFLTVLGYGMGNYKDNKMQKLADKGNGNHAYIDNIQEAKKVLVNEFGGTLFTIAKDVKLQVEFNPAKVQAYRLVGYENRMLNKEDFNNDKKDAGDMGSGHTVTALYEVIPVGVHTTLVEKTDPLKYRDSNPITLKNGDELMHVKIRYKEPRGEQSRLLEHPVKVNGTKKISDNFRLAASVAQYGMLLGNSEFRQQSSFSGALQLASTTLNGDREGYRQEFISLLKKAAELAEEEIVIRK